MLTFRENAKFGISYSGMDAGFCTDVVGTVSDVATQRDVQIVAFNLTTDPCLPNPKKTSADVLWPIYCLLLGCVVSCLVDAYVTRFKSRIANFYFPERAKERAEFLHRSIRSGRISRKNDLRKYFCDFFYLILSWAKKVVTFTPFQDLISTFSYDCQ